MKLASALGAALGIALAGVTIYTTRLDGFDRLVRSANIDRQDQVFISLEDARPVVSFVAIASTIGGLVAGLAGSVVIATNKIDEIEDKRREAEKLLTESISPAWGKDRETVDRNYTL